MRFVGIIPARYNSSRFPGKPLVQLPDGKTMIQHVYEQATKVIAEVWVATDDERILAEVEGFGGRAMMTSKECCNGTQRCAELARQFYNLNDHDIVVNIQGDQPLINPEYIRQLVRFMMINPASIGTLVCGNMTDEDAADPNCVKAYVDSYGMAARFDRVYEDCSLAAFKHIGVYAYRWDILRTLATLEYSDSGGSLEQNSWLEHYRIHCVAVFGDVISVDVPEDLVKVEQIQKK